VLEKAGKAAVVHGRRIYAVTGGKAVGSQCDEYSQYTTTLELADVAGIGS
jgi:hypothetical protein